MVRRIVQIRRPRSQDGTAYVLTLLALVVLTILALSLSLITQTEMRIGANELTVQRVFYAADSGVGAAAAKALAGADYDSMTFSVGELGLGLLGLSQQVDVSPFLILRRGPCNLCSINQGSEFFQVNHAVTATASRQGLDLEGNPVALGAKSITVMVEVQPWEDRFAPQPPEEIAKVKL